MASHDPDQNKKISEKDIIDQYKTFYNSAHDTTMNVLSWAVLLWSIHTDWQDKARAEVFEILAKKIHV